MFRRLRALWRLGDQEVEEQLGGLQWATGQNARRLNSLDSFLGQRRPELDVLTKRLDTLSARIDLLQPREKNMAPCPACQDGLVFTPGDADDPASHDRCQLCEGTAEVREGVAAYVGVLERRLKTQKSQGRGWQESAVFWRKRYNEGGGHRSEEDPQAAVVIASGESGPDAGVGESMGREG